MFNLFTKEKERKRHGYRNFLRYNEGLLLLSFAIIFAITDYSFE